MTRESPVVELVSFRLSTDLAPEAFVALAKATEPVLRRQPGYVSRKLVHNPDGVWIDIVEWESLAAAREAARTILTNPALAPFVSAIGMGSVGMALQAFRLFDLIQIQRNAP